MNSGAEAGLLRVVLLILAIGAGAARAERDIDAPTGAWGIAQLMDALREVRSGSARFVERRYLQLMTAPLQSSGLLRYAAPDRLDKQTLLPEPFRLAISGDVLSVERPGSAPRVIALRDYPDIAALIGGIRATMAGDRITLERFFSVMLRGKAAEWQLMLVPRDAAMRAMVTQITIIGRHNQISAVETREADGDRSEMTIDPDPQ